jgi:hypothetical protein
MLNAHDPETSSGVNWGGLAAILIGALSGIHAWFRKRPRRNIPTENATEIFERLAYLEKSHQKSAESDGRVWGEIVGLKTIADEIREKMVDRQDLRDFEKKILRLLDGR